MATFTVKITEGVGLTREEVERRTIRELIWTWLSGEVKLSRNCGDESGVWGRGLAGTAYLQVFCTQVRTEPRM